MSFLFTIYSAWWLLLCVAFFYLGLVIFPLLQCIRDSWQVASSVTDDTFWVLADQMQERVFDPALLLPMLRAMKVSLALPRCCPCSAHTLTACVPRPRSLASRVSEPFVGCDGVCVLDMRTRSVEQFSRGLLAPLCAPCPGCCACACDACGA